MNREQCRTYEKNLRKKGVTPTEAKSLAIMKQKMESIKPLPEGTKVKFNIKSITGDVDYAKKTDRYKAFVDENKDNVFTIEYDAKYAKNPVVVCLKEDPTPVKWLWYVGDLTVVEE